MISRLSLGLAGWLLVLAVIFAPWAYGSTRPEGILVLNIICYTTAFCWLLGRLIAGSLPKVPVFLSLCFLALLLQGWGMTWNAQSIYDRVYHDFAILEVPFPDWPGSVDQSLSREAMTTLSALMLACMAAADMGRNKAVRQRILAAMIITGLSLSVFGLWILLSKSNILWWPYGKSPFMFATFRYHANAGAFLNLVWPLAVASTLALFARSDSKSARLLALLCTLTLLVAVVVNASKGAQAVALVIFLVFVGSFLLFRKKLFPLLNDKILGASVIAVFGILFLFIFLIGAKHAKGRWTNYLEKEGESLRSKVYQVELKMPQDAGWLGWGPATFQAKFPEYNAAAPEKVPMFWLYAHQDYVQTVVEWGYWGTLVWTLVVVIGGLRLFFSMRFQWDSDLVTDPVFSLAILLCLAGVFTHALVDYPLQVASLQLYIFLFLGFAWSSPDWEGKRRRSAKIPPPVSQDQR